jgi:tetratricopeptide (TPR) repeat protein
VIVIGVAVTSFVVFAPSLPNQFVDWDDLENFTVNPSYRGLGWSHLKWMWTTTLLGHYVPLTWMTLGADYLVWGMNPAGYHLTNVVLHCANVALLYVVALRLLGAAMPAIAGPPLSWRLGAAFAALVFGVHPLRVESVTWITERRDVLSGFFYLLAIFAYLRDAAAAPGRSIRRRAWYWIALGSFALALLAKAIVVTLPIVLVVLDVYPLRRLGGARGWWNAETRRRWVEKLPFLLGSAVVVPIALVAARTGANLVPIAGFGVVDRVAISVYGLAFYAWKTVAPLHLSPFYALRTPLVLLSAPYVVSGLAVAGVTAAAIALRRRWPAMGAAWLVYVVTLLPVSGLFQNGPQITADRYSYLPSLPCAVLAGAGAIAGWNVWRERRVRALALAVPGAAALVVIVLAALTWLQVGVWRDAERLWSHALVLGPSSMAHSHLANVRRQQARWAEANEHYRLATLMRPDAAHIRVNWGIALAQQGKLGEAIDRYREALRISPRSADAHYRWGNALFASGALEEAIGHYREAVRIDPDAAEVYSNWGRALAQQGKRDEAIERYREALRIAPHSVPHYNWGNALFAAGELEEAISHYREAARIDPAAAEAYNNWGRALAQLGRWDEAIGKYREALRIRPNYPLASANLDQALARAGRVPAR